MRFASERGPVQAVEDVAFEVEEGGALAIVGESGCGKSVTAMSLLGLLSERAQVTGRARLGDIDLLGADRARCATSAGGGSRWSSRSR